ncbi:helix-hairpin-helix domain-containing protein [Niabella drilacis]|uniref:DNA polymerase beta n=1 Tax=Niabella drilacis (strain DSM 25811 / CCM 8410 / CCUG 62505 / LMG 26954 / E90) TaxID=1285928 RepID=A0A1G6RDQ6_NIADE|nr:helix-hairpin-helix domain-containing protein [Niabella drilacis]SDD02770.1 DNA polymerase/3'-5' exonuclease PolX [Niabella drilacis]
MRQVPEYKNNDAIACIFRQIARCYRYLGGEGFRVAAYQGAAEMLLNMREDIAVYASDIKRLEALDHIGERMAMKITEYLQTGKIAVFSHLKKQVPYGLLELMDISGFGPATLRILYDRLGIKNEDELVEALNDHRLDGVKGIGKRRVENMKVLLAVTRRGQPVSLTDARRIGTALVGLLTKIPGVQRAELCGSIRRKKPLVGDIDILVLAEPEARRAIVQTFIASRHVLRVLVSGVNKASVLLRCRHIQVDIRLMHSREYGAALLYMTGSRGHTVHLRMIAKEKGYMMNEYGLFERATHRKIAGSTEKEMYRALGLKYIPPELRLNNGEIESAGLSRAMHM